MGNKGLRQNCVCSLGRTFLLALVHIRVYSALFQKGCKVALPCSFYGLSKTYKYTYQAQVEMNLCASSNKAAIVSQGLVSPLGFDCAHWS